MEHTGWRLWLIYAHAFCFSALVIALPIALMVWCFWAGVLPFPPLFAMCVASYLLWQLWGTVRGSKRPFEDEVPAEN